LEEKDEDIDARVLTALSSSAASSLTAPGI